MNLLKDILYSFRTLGAKPGYLAIVLMTLCIGIGLTATMFSLVNSILFKPLPLQVPQQLVQLGFETASRKESSAQFAIYQQMKEADTPFQDITFAAFDQGVLSRGEQHTPLTMRITTYDYLSLFGVPPLRGRWYDKDDLGKNVVLLSYETWVSYFDKSDDIVGKSILLNKLAYTVIGIMPAGFRVDAQVSAPELWSPIDNLGRPGVFYGRLKDQLAPEKATLQLESTNRIVNTVRSEKSGKWQVTLTSLKENSVKSIKPALLLLSLAVSAVFLIAIINVVNLTFVHYMDRTHELSVRVALGASRKRLVQQLLTESLILAIGGGLLGLLMTAWSMEAIKFLAEGKIPRLNEVNLDLTTVIATFVLVLLAATVTALLPAFRLLQPGKLTQALSESGAKTTDSRAGHGIRQVLVAAEVTLAVVLLIGAGLMLRSYSKLLDVDPGFATENRITGHIWLPDSYNGNLLNYWQTILPEMQVQPELLEVAATSTLPMGRTGIDYEVRYTYDEAQEAGGAATHAATRAITANYFNVLQIPLLQGRVFDERDNVDSSGVVIINRELASKLWQDVSPIGRKLILPNWMGGERTIVGVVDNVKHGGLRDKADPEFFTPMSQQVYPGMSLVARVREGSESQAIRSMSDTATRYDVAAPLILGSRLKELASRSIEEEKVLLQIIIVFSALALLMASIGVYGISANMVSQRTREIGVRMALGASPKKIRNWVVANALKPVCIGAVLGIVLAVLLVEVISSYLYDVWTLDPIVYLSVPVTLVLVAVLATWLPAQQATSVNPQNALKHE